MTAFFAPDRETFESDDYRSHIGSDRLPEEILVPIMAGAYARGIVETFDLLGLPALFLDRHARVLHANNAAKPFVGGPLQLRTHHVIAREAADNRALSALIATALMPDAGLVSAGLRCSGLTVHALPLPDRLNATGQMLRAVLLLSDADDSTIAMLAQRIAASRA